MSLENNLVSRRDQIVDSAVDGNFSRLETLFNSGYVQEELDLALLNALAYSRIEIADYVLGLGADFSYGNYEGVYFTAHNNELIGMKYAIAKGVDVNVNSGMLLNTAIVTFIYSKDIKIIKWLVENGANPYYLTESSIDLIDRYGTEELKTLIKRHQHL